MGHGKGVPAVTSSRGSSEGQGIAYTFPNTSPPARRSHGPSLTFRASSLLAARGGAAGRACFWDPHVTTQKPIDPLDSVPDISGALEDLGRACVRDRS